MTTTANVMPREVYPGQDFYVPSFKVLIRGQDQPQIIDDVISVSYTDTLKEIDSFDLTVNNWDPKRGGGARGTFKYSSAHTFDPFQDVELFLGYYHNGNDERRRMLLGEITTLTPTFPSSGPSTLTVRALNLLHRFRTRQQTKVFSQKKDSEIAQQIVDDIATDLRQRVPGLTLQLDPAEKSANLRQEDPIGYLVMNSEYPINFLFARARLIGYELSVEEASQGSQRTATFHFRRPTQVTSNTYTLEWGKTLISFSPTLQTARQVSEVVIRGWDPSGKTAIEEHATRADLPPSEIVRPSDLNITESSLAQKLEIVADHAVQNRQEAKRIAIRTLRQLAQGLVEGRGKTVGLPDLRAGSKVQILGLGNPYEGIYLVTGTTHTIGDGGYTTDFTARMEQRLASAGSGS
jgi:uncharacterized protein